MKPKININNSAHFSWRSRWPQWAGYAAALWSLLYGVPPTKRGKHTLSKFRHK